MERKNAWQKYTSEKDKKKVFKFAEDYRKFLSECKTERECVSFFIEKAEKAGYKNLDKIIKEGKKLKAGDRAYTANKGKEIILFNIGTESLENGINILGAHIDSPRMDLKQNPVFEDSDLAILDTRPGSPGKIAYLAPSISFFASPI